MELVALQRRHYPNLLTLSSVFSVLAKRVASILGLPCNADYGVHFKGFCWCCRSGTFEVDQLRVPALQVSHSWQNSWIVGRKRFEISVL